LAGRLHSVWGRRDGKELAAVDTGLEKGKSKKGKTEGAKSLGATHLSKKKGEEIENGRGGLLSTERRQIREQERGEESLEEKNGEPTQKVKEEGIPTLSILRIPFNH